MARIGVRDLFVHEILDETHESITYDTSVRIAGLIEVGISPQTDTAELYADDTLHESATALSSYDININVADLTPEQQGKLLGQKVDEDGRVFSSTDLAPPHFGVSFKAERSDGTYEYRQIFKVKFAPSDDNYNTKGESIDFQTAAITGKAQALLHNRLFDVRVLGTAENKVITDEWDKKMYTEPSVATVP